MSQASVVPTRSAVLNGLNHLLDQPSFPRDTVAIRQCLEGCSRSDKRVRRLLRLYDIRSVVTVAKNIVKARAPAAQQGHTISLPSGGSDSEIEAIQSQPCVPITDLQHNEGSSVTQTHAPVATSNTASPAEHLDSTQAPKQLPMKIQHTILVGLSDVLQRICYTLTAEHLSEIISKEKWDCPEAIELNIWSGVMKRHRSAINLLSTIEADISTDRLLQSLTAIRHATVHRERLSNISIETYLALAESFALRFGIESHQQALRELEHTFSRATAEQETFELRRAAITREYNQNRESVITEYRRQRAELESQHKIVIKALDYKQRCHDQTINEAFLGQVSSESPSSPWTTSNLTYLFERMGSLFWVS